MHSVAPPAHPRWEYLSPQLRARALRLSSLPRFADPYPGQCRACARPALARRPAGLPDRRDRSSELSATSPSSFRHCLPVGRNATRLCKVRGATRCPETSLQSRPPPSPGPRHRLSPRQPCTRQTLVAFWLAVDVFPQALPLAPLAEAGPLACSGRSSLPKFPALQIR